MEEEPARIVVSYWDLEAGKEELRRREERRRRVQVPGRPAEAAYMGPVRLRGGCLLYRISPRRTLERQR